ncbi:MAG: hypothetical protein KAJ14_05570, partial [Candidatus Omnitrophica bacterium]|nr:hypothetical protein [Candidatus Omnitrophota bacterium]
PKTPSEIVEFGRLNQAKLDAQAQLNAFLDRDPQESIGQLDLSVEKVQEQLGKFIGEKFDKNAAEEDLARFKIQILERQLDILRKGGTINLDIPVAEIISSIATSNPGPLLWWVGVKAANWLFFDLLNDVKDRTKDEQMQIMENELDKARAELRAGRMLSQKSRQAAAIDAAYAKEYGNVIDAAKAQVQEKMNGQKATSSVQNRAPPKVTLSYEALIRQSAVNDDQVINSYLNLESAQAGKTVRVIPSQGVLAEDAGYLSKSVDSGFDSQIAISAYELFPELEYVYTYQQQRAQLEIQAADNLFNARFAEAEGRAMESLYELVVVERLLSMLSTLKSEQVDRKIKDELSKRKERIINELKKNAGIDPNTELEIENLNDISIIPNIDVKNMNFNALDFAKDGASSLDAVEARINQQAIIVNSYLNSIGALKPRTYLGRVTGKKDIIDADSGKTITADIEDTALGQYFTTVNENDIIKNIRPHLFRMLSDKIKAEKLSAKVALEIKASISDIKVYSQRIKDSKNVMISFYREYMANMTQAAKTGKGRISEREMSTALNKLNETMEEYMRNVRAYQARFYNLKTALIMAGVDMDS